jgi:hypothetical protein
MITIPASHEPRFYLPSRTRIRRVALPASGPSVIGVPWNVKGCASKGRVEMEGIIKYLFAAF